MNDELIRRVLGQIEKSELHLLSWGVTDGTLSETELEDLVRLAAPTEDPDAVIDALLDRGLLVAKGLSGDRYRTRMAETVRLATSLRQWFHDRPWTMAPSLVSDARFLSRPRVVPVRDHPPTEVADRLRQTLREDWTPAHDQALGAILGGRRISAFQFRSATRLLQNHTGPRGTVVAAGTGAGKTLAFYLPALTRILAEPRAALVPRIIAIYPRTELLRDQLRSLLLLGDSLRAAGVRPPRVGVLYGATPWNRTDATTEQRRRRLWKQVGTGLVFPIVACLRDGCDGRLIWPTSAGDKEELVCEQCGTRLTGEQLTFTRSTLRSKPPDVLFTTTETANLLLGSLSMRHLLVGHATHAPEFLLLDEVHTYAGTHGAQVANLLRRWRAEMVAPPHVVGLSATLSDPAGFFAELSGLTTNSVGVVAPEAHEMQEVGREYFLALRGDPASQTSLLSTTIQTAMLLRRMLDPDPSRPSAGAFGTRLFTFTDDLDIANRLHSQLEDAEGWQRGGVNRKPQGSLAVLRSSSGPDSGAREDAGQRWDFAEQIGTLHRPVRVSRTTSRDAGVDPDADIVVATASLEVGFDDPDVGAILQHKAPRDAAQFLQRRGRAGRDPTMRPWAVVVLSDYGRDRFAFQSYETLFDPIVRPTHLPRRNRVILKMQATWWLLDHLARLTSTSSIAGLVEGPWKRDRDRQRDIATQVLTTARGLLTATGIERLAAQLRRSLGVADDDLRAVLWDYPRGVITAVLPALIRSLEAAAAQELPEGYVWRSPIAEFLPSSLFAPLQTPEVRLVLPGASADDEAEPVSQALRLFAPGRVSYRYALGGRRERRWVPPPPSHDASLALESFCDNYVDLELPKDATVGRLVQPTVVRLAAPPGSVSDSSYGKWDWQVAFDHSGVPVALDIPVRSAWSSLISEFVALTHRHRCPQTTWRYADTFEVERNSSQEPPLTRHALTLEGGPIGVGFAMDVDAVRLIIHLPDAIPTDDRLLRALRVARMEYLIRNGERLTAEVPSRFTRDWLHQVFLSVLVTESRDRSLVATLDALTDDELRARLVEAARNVFGANPTATSPDGDNSPSDPGLITDLDTAVHAPNVIGELRAAASALSAEPDDAWRPWLHEQSLATLGAALLDAVQMTCPEVDASDLRCDIDLRPGGIGEVRISEDQPGGTGVVEAFVDRYVDDPRSFWASVTAALGPGDGERVDLNVRHFLASADDPAISTASGQIRSAADLTEMTAAWRALRLALFRLGLDADQSVVSALATRVLRSGSGPHLGRFLTALIERWDQVENSLGVEVELRVFAHLAASDDELRRQLHAVAGGHSGQAGWDIGQIVGLLWPRGNRLRASALQLYSPYRSFEPTERLLFEQITSVPTTVVDASEEDWRQQLDEALRREGNATLRAESDEQAAEAMHDLLTEPTSVEVLEFHPRVVGVTRTRSTVDVAVELREAQQ